MAVTFSKDAKAASEQADADAVTAAQVGYAVLAAAFNKMVMNLRT